MSKCIGLIVLRLSLGNKFYFIFSSLSLVALMKGWVVNFFKFVLLALFEDVASKQTEMLVCNFLESA